MASAIVPGIYDTAVADRDLGVSTEDAYVMTRRLAAEEGLLVGISSGAALAGALSRVRRTTSRLAGSRPQVGCDDLSRTAASAICPSRSGARSADGADAAMPRWWHAIRDHGRDTYPNECCGALIGRDGVVAETFALPNTTDEGPRRRFLVRPSDYRAAEGRATTRRPRAARVLSLAPGSSGAAVAVRPRSRVAVVLLRHRFGASMENPARSRRGGCARIDRSSIRRRRGSCVIVQRIQRHASQNPHSHAASALHRQARRRRARRRDDRRAARQSDDQVRRAEAASLQRARQAAELRQRLRQRRRHPLSAEGSDAAQGRGYGQHHSVGRRAGPARSRRRRRCRSCPPTRSGATAGI